MAFPANPTVNDLYTTPSGVLFKYLGGYWKVQASSTSPSTTNTTPDIIRVGSNASATSNMALTAGAVTGLPYIQVNLKQERLVLQSELDGTDHSPIDINAGYF